MFDLINEIVTFGPRMAHDDTIDALAYACKYAYPPMNNEKVKGKWKKNKPKAKGWIVA